MAKTLIIIPVRLSSLRFPGKPLVNINGKTMVQRVWESAIKSRIGDVYVACCDREVETVLLQKKIKYIFTKKDLKSGTDRVFYAYNKIKNKNDYDLVINLQGDLPYFNPLYLRKLYNISKEKSFQMATLACPISNSKKITDNNVVKVVMSYYQKNIYRALYFSRSPVPFGAKKYYEHIGVYAYTSKALEDFINMKKRKLERFEKLEQLRALESKVDIFVSLVNKAPVSIDTKNDLKKLLELIKIKEKL